MKHIEIADESGSRAERLSFAHSEGTLHRSTCMDHRERGAGNQWITGRILKCRNRFSKKY